MRATFKKIDLSIVLLVGLTVSIAVTNFFWLSMNQRPPVDDEAGHLVSALKYLHVLGSPERNWVWLSVLDHFYPPLFPFLTALAAYWTGIKGVLPFVMGNVFFMALTFFSLYGIGHKLGDRKIGLLASCLISLYPMFFHMSRMFMLEIPLVGMVSLTMLLLLYTKGFSRTLWSFGAGIAMGLGLLTKQLFPVFLPGPLLYFFLNAGGGVVRHSLKRKGLNLCLFLATGILIALPWYWRDGAVKFNQLATMVTQPIVAGPLEFPLISVPSLTFYLKTLAQDQMGWFFCSAFVFFLILNFRKMLALPFLLIWFTVPYVILTLLPNKFYYYTLPCLPAAALITAWGLLSLKHLVVRRGLIAFVLVWGAFHYGVLSFMSPQIHSRVLHGARYSPIQKDYHVRTLIRRITEESPVLRPTVGAFTIDPNVFFAQTGVHLGENYVLSNLITLNTVASLESKLWSFEDLDKLKKKDPSPKPHFLVLYNTIEQIGFPSSFEVSYQLSDIFVMPDTSHAFLYKLNAPYSPDTRKPIIHHGNHQADLRQGPLRLTLADSSWKLFFSGREITKEFSIYTIVKASGKWVDSHLGRWKVLFLGRDRVVARATNSLFQPAQEWEFVLKDNSVEWAVKLSAPFFAKLEWQQASIMLSDRYKHWRTPFEAGNFPQDFYALPNGDWPTIADFAATGSEFIGVERSDNLLPAVTFYAVDPEAGWRGQIVNSDNNFRGRILQYSIEHTPELFLWPWRTVNFKGRIVIEKNGAPNSP